MPAGRGWEVWPIRRRSWFGRRHGGSGRGTMRAVCAGGSSGSSCSSALTRLGAAGGCVGWRSQMQLQAGWPCFEPQPFGAPCAFGGLKGAWAPCPPFPGHRPFLLCTLCGCSRLKPDGAVWSWLRVGNRPTTFRVPGITGGPLGQLAWEVCGLLGSGRPQAWLLCLTLGLHLPPRASLLAAAPLPSAGPPRWGFCLRPAGGAVSCVPLRPQVSMDAERTR